MKGKVFWGRKRLHTLGDLASSSKYLEVMKAAEDQEGWRAIDRKRNVISQQTTRRRTTTTM